MNKLIKLLGALIVVTTWLAGIVISKGFWSCFAAISVPPYAWYLVVEKVMQIQGWLV